MCARMGLIRLSFAYYNESDLREGIARLKPLLDEAFLRSTRQRENVKR